MSTREIDCATHHQTHAAFCEVCGRMARQLKNARRRIRELLARCPACKSPNKGTDYNARTK